MILIRAEFDYNTNEDIRKLDDSAYTLLRIEFPDLDLPEERPSYHHIADQLLDLKEVEKLAAMGVRVRVSRVKGLHYPESVNAPSSNSVQITNVSVPNHNLYEVNEVDWMENACTQELQERLNKGWRILAVCPSNDARRPDYILGRNNAKSI